MADSDGGHVGGRRPQPPPGPARPRPGARCAASPPLPAGVPRRPPVASGPASPPTPSGHLGPRLMRRSESRPLPVGALGALEGAQRQTLRPPPGDVRVQRRRRPADLGASDLAQRAHSAAAAPRWEARGDPLADAGALAAAPRPACGGCAPPGRGEPGPATSPQGAAARGCSVPATGTVKADDAAREQAKAHAVAALNRLFFEEIAKGGQDPNAAAAAALRRLLESTSQRDATVAPLDGDCAEDFGMPRAEAPAPRPRTPPEITEVGEEAGAGGAASAARPPAPLLRRPKEVLGRVRRPSPAIRVGN